MGSTGLPNGVQQLSCAGDAAPTPDWDASATDAANLPEFCAD
jgi:hypothetical protein